MPPLVVHQLFRCKLQVCLNPLLLVGREPILLQQGNRCLSGFLEMPCPISGNRKLVKQHPLVHWSRDEERTFGATALETLLGKCVCLIETDVQSAKTGSSPQALCAIRSSLISIEVHLDDFILLTDDGTIKVYDPIDFKKDFELVP